MSAEPRSVAELTALLAAGERVKFLFFWGHQPDRRGIGSGCLSQWWPSPFRVDEREFATAEHYMMWRKAMLFDDVGTADRILAAPHPHAAKNLGRRVRGFDQHTWDERRFDIVVDGSVAKFDQHDDLGDFLRGTGDRVLVEASPIDRNWGIGLAVTDPEAQDPTRWRGSNLLGFALMEARARLRERV